MTSPDIIEIPSDDELEPASKRFKLHEPDDSVIEIASEDEEDDVSSVHSSDDELVCVHCHEDYGRMSDLDGKFICTRSDFRDLVKRGTLDLGEVLGKHSDITATLVEGDTLEIVSCDQAWLRQTLQILGNHHLGGINLLANLREAERIEQEEAETYDEEEEEEQTEEETREADDN